MLKIIAKLIGAVERRLHAMVGRITLARSGCIAEGPVQIARHVRLRATDGGTANLGAKVAIDRFSDVTIKNGHLAIGARTYIGQFSVLCAREAITIGADCLIAEHVTIRDQDHRFGPDLVTAQAGFVTAPIAIGNNVWIGAKTTITKGVTIGDNAVIGANSVVTQDIPANCVAVGAPARAVRKIPANV